MNTQGQDLGAKDADYSPIDLWIQSRLQRAIQTTVDAIEGYRFDLAAAALYEFLWEEYCDWYLELAKISLQTGNATQQQATRRTLIEVLETFLRLAHPIMPFITEEIWQHLAPIAGIQGDTIMLQPFPQFNPHTVNEAKEREIAWLKGFILGLRKIRGEINIAPGKPLPVLLQGGNDLDRLRVADFQPYLERLGRVESIAWLASEETPPEAAIALVDDLKILIPMRGLIDKQAELARLEKEIQRFEKELSRLEAKLNNPKFLERAPAELVAKEEQKLEEARAALFHLRDQQARIRAL
jgi:valyl-tRNA synthetase